MEVCERERGGKEQKVVMNQPVAKTIKDPEALTSEALSPIVIGVLREFGDVARTMNIEGARLPCIPYRATFSITAVWAQTVRQRASSCIPLETSQAAQSSRT